MICSLQKSWTMMINIETQLAIAVIQSHFQFAKVLGENCASIFFGGCSSEYAFEFLTCKTLFPNDFRNLNVLFVVRNPRFLCLPPEKKLHFSHCPNLSCWIPHFNGIKIFPITFSYPHPSTAKTAGLLSTWTTKRPWYLMLEPSPL